MTSLINSNANNPHGSRVCEQLLFLEKLKKSDQQCETESSFVDSGEFNAILKQFKREKQKVEDEKKWEIFLKKRSQEQMNAKKQDMQSFYSPVDNQIIDFNSFTFSGLGLPESITHYQLGGHNENNWFSDPYTSQGITLHNNQENEINHQNGTNMNGEYFNQFNDEFQSCPVSYRDESCFSEHVNQNDGCPSSELHYQYDGFKNEEIHDNISLLAEHDICDDTVRKEESNYTEHKSSAISFSNKKTIQKNESIVGATEMKANTPAVQTVPELVVAGFEKIEVIPSPSKGSIPTNTSKKKLDKPQNDKNICNAKISYINEPEENYCKNIAKKIQDIPGVDYELRKVEDIRIKMTPILANIKIVIAKNANSLLSSDEDIERIQQRTLEFGARFKRNYLYRTNCEVNKLKEIIPNPLLICKKSKILLVIQKLTGVHHSVIQALQVIEKQLQTISIFGKTQELICSFYNCIYELTSTLKPFYGYLKSQILDDVEKHLIETIKLLNDSKLEEKFSIPTKSQKQTKQFKAPVETPPWMKKSAALARLKFGPPLRVRKRKSGQERRPKIPGPKQNKGSVIIEKAKKMEQEKDINKPVNFMMNVKQRPGAELRRANFDQVETDEPKTMIEIISREGSTDQIISKGTMKTSITLESNKEFVTNEKNMSKDEHEKGPPKKMEPRNVKLICMKRENYDYDENTAIESRNLHNKDEVIQWEDLLKYRHTFKKYKKLNPLYEKNTLNTVVSMSERFLEEAIIEVSKEVNKMKIADLLGIVDEVECSG